ncbi:unnamed protein product [Linum trigynum]|uniref:SWI/SNF complex subunit SWI3D n=1 Tax=Linum trigynum TaxID=586398 RepID=A0AAV2CAI3_9ROSI
MEDQPAGSPAAATPGADAQPSADAPSSRRRAGGLKRKANSLSTSTSSSSTPSKRMTRDREKAAMSLSLAQIHNGPLTRAARHGPSTFGSSSGGRGAAGGVKLEEKERVGLAAAMAAAAAEEEEEERNKLEELGKKIEAEFEAVRSRDSNAHVVPNHCGWFSWTKVHPLEERALSNFFNGKSPDRTPATYMEIRNWIMKKFHTNPNEQIELKDLSNLEFADLEARQEVLEFLDYWGLINFHPFPQMPDNSENSEDAGTTTSDSLLEKLFRFGPVPSCADVAPKPSSSTTSVSSGLFPDSTIAEELLQPEGPSVEYHCNSCSADCSRKRYHCQKQADYDLCADCFNNGKFDPDMSSSDFILMEPAEAHGLSGGKWTDQETLLLLEALEIYKENWNEIAEHVATKTKAQCILHFVQMPIEDSFLDSNNVDDTAKEVADTSATNETAPETSNVKTCSKEDQVQTSPMETSKPEDTIEVKDISENGSEGKESAPQVAKSDADEGKEISETPKPDAGDGKTREDDVAFRALTEAFEAVGYAYSPGLSFAEVGNPVMAMAAFFVRLVGGDVVSASARISLKSVSSSSPGLQLATRHCFLLEDPPDTRKEQGDGDCDVAEKTEQHDAPIGNQDDKNESVNTATPDPDVLVSASDLDNDKNKVSSTDKNKSVDFPNDESNEKEKTTEVGLGVSQEGGGANVSKEVSVSDQPLDTEEELHEPQPMSESSPEPVKKQDSSPVTVKEQEEGSSAVDHPQVKVMGDNVEVVSSAEKVEPSSTSLAGEVLDQAAAEVSKDVGDIVSDAIPVDKDDKQEQVKPSLTVEDKVHTEDIDMTSSQPSEGKNDEKPEEDDEKRISTSIVVEDGATAGEARKDSSTKEKSDCEGSKDGCKIDKLKRAGVAALSAAAVKAKLLADQEEDQIRQLAAALIEKQLQKLEMKLAFFNDMDTVILRVKEQLDRSRQRLYQERAQIIAARLGYPASSSSSKPPAHPALAANRIAMNFANAFPRPPMGLASAQMTPVSRPMGGGGLGNNASSNPFNPTVPVNSVMPSGQDTPLSSVETK